MLHNRLLNYLDEVVRCGSIRAASRKLNIASSAINRQILALEADLGTPIFDRLPRRLRLTAVGELLIEHVRTTLRSHERLGAQIADFTGLRWGRVTVATVGTVAAEILPTVIASFRNDFPRSTIDVRMVGDVLANIQSDEVDLGIGFDLPVPPGIRAVFDIPVILGAVMRPDHPLANRSSVSLATCSGFPLILPSKEMSSRPILDRGLQDLEASVKATIITNSSELMKQAAKRDQGIAFLTNLNVHEEHVRGELVFVPLTESKAEPLHLRAIMKIKRQNNLMTDPFILRCELQATNIIAATTPTPPSTDVYQL